MIPEPTHTHMHTQPGTAACASSNGKSGWGRPTASLGASWLATLAYLTKLQANERPLSQIKQKSPKNQHPRLSPDLHVHKHTRTSICTHLHTCLQPPMCAHAHSICTRLHACLQVPMDTPTQTCIHPHMHADEHPVSAVLNPWAATPTGYADQISTSRFITVAKLCNKAAMIIYEIISWLEGSPQREELC